MKPQTFDAPRGALQITWQPRDRSFICYRPHVSVFCTTPKEVLAFAKWPASTPTGAALREWLNSLQVAEPGPDGLTPELLATGFGPEAHGEDPDQDPTANTRTII